MQPANSWFKSRKLNRINLLRFGNSFGLLRSSSGSCCFLWRFSNFLLGDGGCLCTLWSLCSCCLDLRWLDNLWSLRSLGGLLGRSLRWWLLCGGALNIFLKCLFAYNCKTLVVFGVSEMLFITAFFFETCFGARRQRPFAPMPLRRMNCPDCSPLMIAATVARLTA